MHSDAVTPDQYVRELPDERKEAVMKIRKAILENIPDGFVEGMSYGMVGYAVPHSLYPKGYHCDPKLPLPFMGFASQKNFIALYHMGIYADQNLSGWFIREYVKRCGKNPDMGKSCIRFKKKDTIPYDLIGELASKISAEEWIRIYEAGIAGRKQGE